jgi:hypothetical protein
MRPGDASLALQLMNLISHHAGQRRAVGNAGSRRNSESKDADGAFSLRTNCLFPTKTGGRRTF